MAKRGEKGAGTRLSWGGSACVFHWVGRHCRDGSESGVVATGLVQSGFAGGSGAPLGGAPEEGIVRRVGGGCFSEKKKTKTGCGALTKMGGGGTKWGEVGRSGVDVLGTCLLSEIFPLKPKLLYK